MTTLEGITLSIAVLGAVLGLVNTWHSIDRTRVKLRVIPKHAIPLGAADATLNFCIEVTNLSAFAVTIHEVGVYYRGTKERGAYTQPVLLDRGGWPRRLEAREAVTVYGQAPRSKPGRKLKCVYARTACGVVRSGNSPAFQQIAAQG